VMEGVQNLKHAPHAEDQPWARCGGLIKSAGGARSNPFQILKKMAYFILLFFTYPNNITSQKEAQSISTNSIQSIIKIHYSVNLISASPEPRQSYRGIPLQGNSTAAPSLIHPPSKQHSLRYRRYNLVVIYHLLP
jgi:hypothetical protein